MQKLHISTNNSKELDRVLSLNKTSQGIPKIINVISIILMIYFKPKKKLKIVCNNIVNICRHLYW